MDNKDLAMLFRLMGADALEHPSVKAHFNGYPVDQSKVDAIDDWKQKKLDEIRARKNNP